MGMQKHVPPHQKLELIVEQRRQEQKKVGEVTLLELELEVEYWPWLWVSEEEQLQHQCQ
jgi:hypothetical protein